LATLRVKFVRLDPSAFMTKISSLPPVPRLVEKAIFAPSGDQAGDSSSAGLFVRFLWPLPSAFMTKISPLP
jgi:hypothetical protein